VSDCSDVNVRFASFEFFFSHLNSPPKVFYLLVVVGALHQPFLFYIFINKGLLFSSLLLDSFLD
jgi:hypothetical protein